MKKFADISPKWLFPMLWLLHRDTESPRSALREKIQQELRFGPNKKSEEQ